MKKIACSWRFVEKKQKNWDSDIFVDIVSTKMSKKKQEIPKSPRTDDFFQNFIKKQRI